MRKKTSTSVAIKSFLFAFIVTFVFLGSGCGAAKAQPEKGETGGKMPDQSFFYVWGDESGNSYVTVKSQTRVDPKTVYPEHPEIELLLVNKKVPIKQEPGFQMHTYRMVKSIRKSYKIVPNDYSTIVYLIGETHLGEPQKNVAKIMYELINKHEIDAILLEQPDHLYFKWENFKDFEKVPGKAIAVLRDRMISDANRKSDYNWGKYRKYFKDVNLTSREISKKIYDDFGEAGIQEVNEIINAESPQVNATLEVYEKSESISAADYFYIMLNLQGINIPFHNVESIKLRTEFDEWMKQRENQSSPDPIDEALDRRDKWMTNRIKEITKSNGYRQVILICGALHLSSLEPKLSKTGFKVNIVYNSLLNNKKKEMAVLVKPMYVIDLVKNSTMPVGIKTREYIIENNPSDDLMNSFDDFFKKEHNPELNSEQISKLRSRLIEEYRKKGLRAKTDWELELPYGNDRTVVIKKNSRGNQVEIAVTKPIGNKELSTVINANTNYHSVDMQNIVQLDEIYRNNKDTSLTFTIENKISHYEVYHNNMEPIYNGKDLSELLKVLEKQLVGQQAIYLDMKDFNNSDKIELFATSLRLQREKQNSKVTIHTVPRKDNSTELRNILLMPGTIEISTKMKPKVEEIMVGEHKGWFKISIGFIKRIGNTTINYTMHFIFKTYALGVQFCEKIYAIFNGKNYYGSMASIVNGTLLTLLKDSDKPFDDKFKMLVEDQYGNREIVLLQYDIPEIGNQKNITIS